MESRIYQQQLLQAEIDKFGAQSGHAGGLQVDRRLLRTGAEQCRIRPETWSRLNAGRRDQLPSEKTRSQQFDRLPESLAIF